MISDIGGRRPTPDRQPTQPAQRHAHDGRHPEPIDFTLSNQDIFEWRKEEDLLKKHWLSHYAALIQLTNG